MKTDCVTRPECIACALHTQCRSEAMNGYGNEAQGGILIIGDAPNDRDDFKGQPFNGKAADLLRRTLKRYRVDMTRVRYTNALRCKPPENKAPSVKQINACRDLLVREIDDYTPEYILLLGNTPLRAVLKKAGITKQRRTVFAYTTPQGTACKVIAAFHPGHVMKQQNELKRFEGDIKFFADVVTNTHTHIGKLCKHINAQPTAKQLLAWYTSLKYKPRPVAFDVETTSLYPHLEHDSMALLCLGLSDGKKTFVIRWQSLRSEKVDRKTVYMVDNATRNNAAMDVARMILADPCVPKIAHNAKYDLHCLQVLLGIRVEPVVCDTLLLHALLFPQEGGHDLSTVACDLLKIDDYAKMLAPYVGDGYNSKAYGKIPYKKLARYNAYDIVATHAIYVRLLRRLVRMDKQHVEKKSLGVLPSVLFDKLIMRAMYTLYDAELLGFTVDREHLEGQHGVGAALSTRLLKLQRIVNSNNHVKAYNARHTAEVIMTIAQRKRAPADHVRARMLNDCLFNLNSDDNVRELLFTAPYFAYTIPDDMPKTDGGQTSVSASALELLKQSLPPRANTLMLDTLIEHSALHQRYTTFIAGLAQRIARDGRVHANFNLGVTRTGRLSSSKPNLQNIPREKEFRNIFTASDGMQLVKADYSQIELRVLAVVARDENMIDIFQSGRDFHAETARRVFNIPNDAEVSKELRSRAKGVNFGVAYGEGAYGLARNIGITLEQAEEFITAYYSLFHGLHAWQEKTKAFVRMHGYVQSIFGRRRMIANATIKPYAQPDWRKLVGAAYRMAVNTPIQSAASDMCLCSANALAKRFTVLKLDARVLSIVHDEIITECADALVPRVADLIRMTMTREPLRWVGKWFTDVPIIVDVEGGKSWGSTLPII